MRWIDLLRMSSNSLRRRKLRTFLTVLGVVVGTASIVVMVSLGLGMQQSIYEEVEQSGGMTAITVTGKAAGSDMMYMSDDASQEDTKYITDETIKELEKVEHVQSASPKLVMSSILLSGKYYGHIQLVGLTPEEMQRQKFKMVEGSHFPEGGTGTLELIYGNGIPTMFYEKGTDRGYWDSQTLPEIDFMKDQLFLILDEQSYYENQFQTSTPFDEGQSSETKKPKPPKKHLVQGCGMIEGDLQTYNAHYNNVYCDLNTMRTLLQKEFAGRAIPGQPTTKTGKPYGFFAYTSALVQADDIDNVEDLAAEIQSKGFNVETNAEFLKSMQRQFAMVQALLGGIGAVSLFVAAIGIANTMMMSIYERTKEIGVIKVLGCSLRNIKQMFLLEAGFIGLIGGVVGNIISFLLSFGINWVAKQGQMMGANTRISYIPLWLVVGSLAFAVFVGMAAGYFPAVRATKLSPLEAIRNN